MIRRCLGWHEPKHKPIILGECEPFTDLEYTDGMCESCAKKSNDLMDEEVAKMKAKPNPFKVIHSLEVSDRSVADLLVSAFEGGSNYWIDRTDIVKKGNVEFGSSKPMADDYYPWVVLAPMGSGEVRIYPTDDDKAYTLNRAALQRGLELMCSKYPRRWSDFINEGDDADTGDVFLQLALLGDIVYG